MYWCVGLELQISVVEFMNSLINRTVNNSIAIALIWS